jgi:hypothetical protein
LDVERKNTCFKPPNAAMSRRNSISASYTKTGWTIAGTPSKGIGLRRPGGYLPVPDRACPRANQTRRNACRRTQDIAGLGKSSRVVLLVTRNLHGAHLHKAQSYRRASFRLTPLKPQGSRIFHKAGSQAPTIVAMSGQPEMPEGGRA